jgi:hypothetical protein
MPGWRSRCERTLSCGCLRRTTKGSFWKAVLRRADELATSTREMVHRTEPGSPELRLPDFDAIASSIAAARAKGMIGNGLVPLCRRSDARAAGAWWYGSREPQGYATRCRCWNARTKGAPSIVGIPRTAGRVLLQATVWRRRQSRWLKWGLFHAPTPRLADLKCLAWAVRAKLACG